MALRIWHQSMAPLGEFGSYAACLEKHAAAVIDEGTEVVLHGAAPGSYAGRPPATVLAHSYARLVITQQVIGQVRQAEREGYDAVALATFGAPFLTECRSLVDIPVVSMAQVALLTAGNLATRPAVVALSAGAVPRMRALLRGVGLGAEIVVVGLRPAVTEVEIIAALDGADDGVAASFEQAAGEAAAAGADLVIPGEGALNELLYQRGVRQAGGLGVLDPFAVVLAWTEMLVMLRRRTGLSTSHAGGYSRPDDDLLAALDRADSRPEVPASDPARDRGAK